MMFKNVLIAAAAFAASVLGQGIAITNAPPSISPGTPFTITWSGGSDAPVTLILKNGPVGNLQTVQTLTTTATSGSYTDILPDGIPDGSYAIEISSGDGTPNWWGPVQVIGSTAQSAASSASSVISSQVSMQSSLASSISVAASSKATSFPNTTMTSSSSSTSSRRTSSSTGSTSAPTATGAPEDNSAPGLGSPIALVLGAVAAMAYLA